MVKVVHKGNFNNTERFLKRMSSRKEYENLERFGRMGVEALAQATPVDTGKTAASWYYEIRINSKGVGIYWKNSNTTPEHIPIAILIQYGHATRNGGYVQGRDFINPAILPIFDQMVDDVWKEVTL